MDFPIHKFDNLTKREPRALYDLNNDMSIVIKGADKGLAVSLWYRGPYIK